MDSQLVVSAIGTNNEVSYSEGVYSFRHIKFRELEEFDPEGFKAVVSIFRGVGDNFFQTITDENWDNAGTYIQMVIVATDLRERTNLINYLTKCGPNTGRKLFGFVVEKDHIHVIHSCPFNSRECKCKWKRDIPRGKWFFKKSEGSNPRIYWGRTNFKDFGLPDWLYVFIYFFFRKRVERGGKCAWLDGADKGLIRSRKY